MIKMLESYPLGVMLWVCLGIDLALGDLVNELGRNLDIMIDSEVSRKLMMSTTPRRPQDQCTGTPLDDSGRDG